jgi:hypothetical protein
VSGCKYVRAEVCGVVSTGFTCRMMLLLGAYLCTVWCHTLCFFFDWKEGATYDPFSASPLSLLIPSTLSFSFSRFCLFISFFCSIFSLPFFNPLSPPPPFSSLPLPSLSLSLSLFCRRTNEWICLYQSSKAFSTVTSMLVHNEKVYVTGIPHQTKGVFPLRTSHCRVHKKIETSLNLNFFFSLRTYVRTCRLGSRRL